MGYLDHAVADHGEPAVLGCFAFKLLCAQLPKEVVRHPLFMEYVQEAEHQDGWAYWNQFEAAGQMANEFQLYTLSKVCETEGHSYACDSVDAENGRETIECQRCGHSVTLQF